MKTKSSQRRQKNQGCPLAILLAIVSILAASGAFAEGSAAPTAKAQAAPKMEPTAKAQPSSGLALEEFLKQVSEKNEAYLSATQSARGAKSQAAEGSLVYSPQLTANASASADGRTNPLTTEDKLRIRSYNVGIGQQTNFGLSGKLALNATEVEIPHVPTYNASWLSLDLSQSLLRNWAGRETRAQAEAATSGSMAKSHAQSFVTQQILLEAESSYWRLALARERVSMVRDAVARGERLLAWTKRRTSLNLADQADFLQASTNLQAQRLELKRAEDDERAAAQAFNSSRGVNSNIVSEQLVDLTPELISRMDVPARTIQREDVQAAEFQARASAAAANIARERNTPTFEVFASVPLTEPATSANAAVSSSLPASSRPFTTVGLKLVAPLDFSSTSQAREGYAAEAAAASQSYSRKSFEAERDWSDLAAKFKQAKERLNLVKDLEAAQKTKLDYERGRHERGRSTTAQVLIFENDYSQSQLGRLQTLAEVLTLNAQMKLYGVSYESR